MAPDLVADLVAGLDPAAVLVLAAEVVAGPVLDLDLDRVVDPEAEAALAAELVLALVVELAAVLALDMDLDPGRAVEAVVALVLAVGVEAGSQFRATVSVSTSGTILKESGFSCTTHAP